MKSRRRAREAALQALYSCDTLSNWSYEPVDLYFSILSKQEDAIATPQSGEAALKISKLIAIERRCTFFARQLARGVVDNLRYIDRRLEEASDHWKLGRMSRVDRNILRLACYEMVYMADVPMTVSIDEAIELAKAYGNEESPGFVNGVLDSVSKNLSLIPLSLAAGMNAGN